MHAAELQNLLSLADQQRKAQQWAQAVRLYRQLERHLSGQAAFHHNLALCLLGANQPHDALAQSELALAGQAGLWQAAVVKVRALVALGRAPEAAGLLDALRRQFPERAEFALELASITLHEACDARRARQLVQPFLASPTAATDATLTDLMASLYERDESAQSVNQRAILFARTHLDRSQPGQSFGPGAAAAPAQPKPKGASHRKGHRTSQRKRLGLLSPLFNCSPVFFFCSGALALLASEFDLYFFNRSGRSDWATGQLRALASQWFDVADLSAEPLDAFLRQHALDVLVDLGGWMDPIALKAISTKPAARMYKWVGGQSITTGLRAFDGFISDAEQTPAGFEPWFTEPLVRLPQGYVSYQPPPYMPAPVPASAHSHVLGVIANPVKLSQAFLAELCASLPARAGGALPLELRFIDKRYQQPQLTGRVLAALQSAQAQLGAQLSVTFVVPASHPAYLGAVGQLSEMLDTFPYSGGLTTIEALSLGVPCSGKVGTLFCERHTHAHGRYLQAPGARRKRAAHPRPGAPRRCLVPPDSPRANHAALAASLAQLFA